MNACGSFGSAAEDGNESQNDGGVPSADLAAGRNVSERPDASVPATKQADDAGSGECKPPDICPKRVFVTAEFYKGDMGGVTGADQKCMDAAKAGLKPTLQGKSFVAWVSVPSGSAFDRIWSEGKYARIDGKLVSNSIEGLRKGLLNPIVVTQNNTTISADFDVWTGTQGDGTVIGNCTDWGKEKTVGRGKTGQATAIDSQWTDHMDRGCGQKARLYCFEK